MELNETFDEVKNSKKFNKMTFKKLKNQEKKIYISILTAFKI